MGDIKAHAHRIQDLAIDRIHGSWYYAYASNPPYIAEVRIMTAQKNNFSGFTLIELLTVIAIIGILA
ncbi:MAG: prepilin-type N-terminal cleavage/methylation domain-containing protein, partial [Candidatus Hydrogenedentes bacterium]|nr:prepilin-type N-terminal cleavage/methylation domain-containing protein [Candidatus Hydrogenedentota bacterium]